MVEGFKNLAHHAICEFDEAKVGGTGDADVFFIQVEDVAVTAKAFDGGRLVGFDSWDVDAVVIVFEEVFGGDEGAVGDPDAGDGGEGAWVYAASFFCEVFTGGVDDALIGPMVGGVAVACVDDGVSALTKEARWIGDVGRTERDGAAGVFGLPFANAAVFKTVVLVGTGKVHAADEAGFIAGQTYVMRPGGNAGVEKVRVFPDAIL